LLGDAKQLKICFIFSNVDNNPEYSPSEMMRIARDFAQYFLLDDIANVKLFGASKFSTNELKLYKKPIVLGDGYSYDSRNGIEKIKLVKCERM
jgi:S-DNA-T family DNA segregation ATPase FtsK/SpoIIIE